MVNFKFSDGKLIINIGISTFGRFRFKKRESLKSYGESFSTRGKIIDDSVYLEWQIGYDAAVNDVFSNKKATILEKIEFTGANGKQKHPYELSEYLFLLLKNDIIKKTELDGLINYIDNIDKYFGERTIRVDFVNENKEFGFPLSETIIALPTFHYRIAKNTIIEVSIQKQQYAAGVQPMVYFSIPITSFDNYENIAGSAAKKGDTAIFSIDKDSKSCIIELFRIFGTCSKRHKKDVLTILKAIKNYPY